MRKVVIRTQGGFSLSGLDANRWRQMLSSKVFGSCTSNIRIVIDDVIEHICINEMEF